jgi:hypothetical protein
MEQKQKSQIVKSNALLFNDPNCFAKTVVKEGENPRLEMTAYSGGVILNHWYWGNIAFDLKGVKLPKGPSPILEEHSLQQKIGIAHKYSTENNKLEVKDASFVSTSFSEEFQKLSSEGFPYQCSIRGVPTKIEQVAEGSFAEVNGFKLKGPGHVWREWSLKESSVCVFGADSNTSAKSFSENEEEQITFFIENKNQNDKGENNMFDVEKFKVEQPDAFTSLEKDISEKVTRDLEDKFALERETFAKQIKDLTEKSTKMTDEHQERLQKLETALAEAKEKELEFEAKAFFNGKVSKTNFSDKQRVKINALVPYVKFIADGKLDTNAFGKALDEEIKEWEEFNNSVPSPTVIQGMGNYQRKVAGDVFSVEDADTEADALFNLVK